MKAANRRLFSAAASVLLAATLFGAGGHPEAVTGYPADLRSPVDPPPVVSPDEPTEVGWRLLAKLNYRTGEKSEELAALEGKLVKVPGFTVPLEDFASSATEFLLVPYVGACIHTPPPPPNQLVYIEMDEGKRAKMDGWNPVWVEGVLSIEMTESVYGYVGFTISGQRVYPYES